MKTKNKSYKAAIRKLRGLAVMYRQSETKSRSDGGFWIDAVASGEKATALEYAAEKLERA